MKLYFAAKNPHNMVTVNDNIYRGIADSLLARIGDENFFNGTVEYDTDEFYSALKCTLIICRNEDGEILSVLPVWWEYTMNFEDGEHWNDFSWQEFDRFLSE